MQGIALRIFTIVYISLQCFACAYGPKKHKKPTINPLEDLSLQKEVYLSLLPTVQGEAGFVEGQECDSLLWSGLVSASGGSVDLIAARDDSGLWHRTPSHDCYESGRSGSQTSKDMLLGLEWALFSHQENEEMRRLWAYGDSHKWVFGKGSLDRTYFHVPFQNTLRVLIGKDPNIPEFYVDPLKDHQRHILALDIVLRGEVQGKIDDNAYNLLKKWYKIDPDNALFSFAVNRYSDGDQSGTIEILKRFPQDRLPTNQDWCGRWLWERSQHSEHWQPCDEIKNHSGGDFLFIVGLLERSRT